MILATAFSLASTIISSIRNQPWDTLASLQAALSILAFAAAGILVSQEHMKSRISSTILLLFYPLYLLLSAIRLRTWAFTRDDRDFLVFGLDLARVLATVVAYAIELVSPEIKDGAIQLGILEKESPLATANIYSRWLFGWITPLMKLGAKKYITEDDLDGLLSRDSSAELGLKLKLAIDAQ